MVIPVGDQLFVGILPGKNAVIFPYVENAAPVGVPPLRLHDAGAVVPVEQAAEHMVVLALNLLCGDDFVHVHAGNAAYDANVPKGKNLCRHCDEQHGS